MEKKIYSIEIYQNYFDKSCKIELEEHEILKETPKQYRIVEVDGFNSKRLSKEQLENNGYQKDTYSNKYYGFDKDFLIKKIDEMLKYKIEKHRNSLVEAEEMLNIFNEFKEENK